MEEKEMRKKLEALGRGNPIFETGYFCGYYAAIENIIEYVKRKPEECHGNEE